MPEQEAVARAAASSIVENVLRGPVALVTGDSVRLRSDDYGNVRLPMRPVKNVSAITFDNGWAVDLTQLVIDGSLIQGLPRDTWVTTVYDHGWDESEVPDIVRTIIDSLTARLMNNQDDALRAESIGGYRVEYDTDARWLTDNEILALSRCSRSLAGITAMPTTAPTPPPDVPSLFGVIP